MRLCFPFFKFLSRSLMKKGDRVLFFDVVAFRRGVIVDDYYREKDIYTVNDSQKTPYLIHRSFILIKF